MIYRGSILDIMTEDVHCTGCVALDVEAECSLGLALLVGGDESVLAGVTGGHLQDVQANLAALACHPK